MSIETQNGAITETADGQPIDVTTFDGAKQHRDSRDAALYRMRNKKETDAALEEYFTQGASPYVTHPSTSSALAPLKRVGNQLLDFAPWGRVNSDALVRQQLQGQYNMFLYLLDQQVNRRIRERGRSVSVAVLGTGGGIGKSAISANIAINIAYAAQVSVLIIETNENDGTLHFKMGIDRDGSPLLPDAVRNPELIKCGASIASNFGKHSQTTTYAILSHPRNAESQFTLQQLNAFGTEAEKHVGVVVYDTGNGLGRNEIAALKADVLIVPIYARDLTKYSTAFSTLANLYSMGHVDKVTKHSRVVITGVEEGETLDDHRDRILAAVISARRSIVDEKETWSEDPLKILHTLGLAREVIDETGSPIRDESGKPELVLCDEKFDLVAYNDYVNTTNPASILPEDTGLETSVGFLKAAHNAIANEFPSHELKLKEEDRRVRETNEASSHPMIDASSQKAVISAVSNMSLTELQTLMDGAAIAKAALKQKGAPDSEKSKED